MTDTDNTGESATAYYGISFLRKAEVPGIDCDVSHPLRYSVSVAPVGLCEYCPSCPPLSGVGFFLSGTFLLGCPENVSFHMSYRAYDIQNFSCLRRISHKFSVFEMAVHFANEPS